MYYVEVGQKSKAIFKDFGEEIAYVYDSISGEWLLSGWLSK